MKTKTDSTKQINRRGFLHSAAAAGAGLMISPAVLDSTEADRKTDDINVGLIGVGTQGQRLLDASFRRIPGVKYKAICDIWDYPLNRYSRIINHYQEYGHTGHAYTDYREMLDKEKDLDAVIIATPDFWHAEQTIACLEAGLHVYCEKEMSNTLDGARKMVEAARRTGKYLQIGHQRRSNYRYRFCYEKLLHEAKLLGQITSVYGQWNRSRAKCRKTTLPKKLKPVNQDILQKYGFESMRHFLNWRWYKGLGGGPVVDLGSHQIDIYNWFLETPPKSITACGGTDYWKDRQWYDNVTAIFEYEIETGIVRAIYQTLTTNSRHGYYEAFLGDEATLQISEAQSWKSAFREHWVEERKWQKWVNKGYLKKKEGLKQEEDLDAVLDLHPPSPRPAEYEILVTMDKKIHQPHLENFFDAVRGKGKLNCPAEIGYETAVSVLKVNDAVEAEKKLYFQPDEFIV